MSNHCTDMTSLSLLIIGAVPEKKKELKTTIKTMKTPKNAKKEEMKVEKVQQAEGTVSFNIRTSSGAPIKTVVAQEVKLKDALKNVLSGRTMGR